MRRPRAASTPVVRCRPTGVRRRRTRSRASIGAITWVTFDTAVAASEDGCSDAIRRPTTAMAMADPMSAERGVGRDMFAGTGVRR